VSNTEAVMAAATQLILAEINATGWPEHPGPAEPWDINRGRCVDWAEIVCRFVPAAQMEEHDDPETGMLHTFVVLAGRYFDAECPGGADFVTDLPCFGHPYGRGSEEDRCAT
jgi:hypothetical protein